MQNLGPVWQGAIGIVAGAGPEAGLTFWKKLLAAVRQAKGAEYKGDLDAPRVRILSEPTLGLVTDFSRNEPTLQNCLDAVIAELSRSCDRIVVACHALQGLAAQHPGDAVVLLPDLVCRHAVGEGLTRVGLLAAPSIVADPARSPYAGLWDVAEVEVPKDPADVLDVILLAKRVGASHPEVVSRVHGHLAQFSAESVYLACTDFSEIPINPDVARVVDIMDIAARSIARS